MTDRQDKGIAPSAEAAHGTTAQPRDYDPAAKQNDATGRPRELGGPQGPEPTRYGDWERKGRCIDF